MFKSDYQQTVGEFKDKLVFMETKARKVSSHVKAMGRGAESLKIELLQHLLETKIISEARRRGMSCLMKDKKWLRSSLLISLGGFVIGGLLAKDKFAALDTGLSSFDGILQRIGDAKWIVSFNKKIVVVPSEEAILGGGWITWESLKTAMCELRKKAIQGEMLSDLDNVIHRLKQERGLWLCRSAGS